MVTQVNDTDAGTTINADTETTFLSVAKTITSGHTVLLIASGTAWSASGTSDGTEIKLKQGSSIVHQISNPSSLNAWACVGIVTGLSGSITFSVTGQGDRHGDGSANGHLVVLEF